MAKIDRLLIVHKRKWEKGLSGSLRTSSEYEDVEDIGLVGRELSMLKSLRNPWDASIWAMK